MRDATDYYNLLSDTLKNGSSQIKYLYDKIENAKLEGKYINIRTGYLIQEKDYYNKDYFFNYDQDFPLCYSFSCCGLARKRVIKKMMDFYLSCLREFDVSHDEDLMKEKIRNELELAKNDYEYLNKNNNGYDDLKLFKTIPHQNEEPDDEPSVNSSSFINDESSEEENNNSFIDDKSISEKKEKRKKCKLIKNGKKVINKYKEELDDLLEDNYDGEDELYQNEDGSENNEENNEKSDEENDSFINDKSSEFKKEKKLYKKKLLAKKTKRNVISDSEEDVFNKETEKKNEEDFQDLLKKYDNSENESKKGKKENLADKEYINQLKENINLKQKTLDAFLKL